MLRAALCIWILALPAFAQPVNQPKGVAADFRISGTVVDSVTGQPLSRVRMAIALVSQRNAFTTVLTSDDGKFRFSPLAPGQYALMGQRRGYITQFFNQHDQLSSSIAVGPDQESGNLLFRLTRESQISGSVTDEQGDAVRDARVLLFQSSVTGGITHTQQRSTDQSDDEGYFHFAHLPSGRYFIAVSATPWYATHPSPPSGLRNFVAMGNNSVNVQGPSGPNPSLASPAAQLPEEGLPSPLDVAYPLTFYPSATDPAAAMAIILGKGERAVVDVNLHPVPALHLYWSTGKSDPNKGVYPALVQSVFTGSEVALTTQSNEIAPGMIELVGVAPGRYTMRVNSWASSGIQTEDESEIDASESGALDGSRSKPFVPVRVALQFEIARSVPKQGTIELRNKKSFEVFSEQLSEKEEVEFKKGLPPGQYEVSLRTSQESFIKGLSATGARLTGRILEIKGGGPVKLNLLVGLGEGTVYGVALHDDKPVAGAMVLLVPSDPANNQVLFRRDQSNTDGSFTLSYVVPGKYTLLAIADGWDLEWANPDVLKKFMPLGETVLVDRPQKYQVKVNTQ